VAYKQHVKKELKISDVDLVFVETLHYQPTTLKSGYQSRLKTIK
jgi:hypothetical protein